MVVIKRQDSAMLVSALAKAAYANEELLKKIFEPCGVHERALMSSLRFTATDFQEPTLRRIFFCTTFARVLKDAPQDEHGNLQLDVRFLRVRTRKEIEATLSGDIALHKARSELIQRFMDMGLSLFAETVSSILKFELETAQNQ